MLWRRPVTMALCAIGIASLASTRADAVDIAGGSRSGLAAFLTREYPEGAGIVSGSCSKIDTGRGAKLKLVVYLFLPRSKPDGYVVEIDETDGAPRSVAIGQVFFEKGKLSIGESSGGFGLDEVLDAEANYLLQKPLHFYHTFREAAFERPTQHCPSA